MGYLPWLGQYWFDLLQSAGIIGSFVFTAVTVRRDEKTRRITNRLALTQQHRDIWDRLYTRPELVRITDSKADVSGTTVAPAERLFVELLVLHLSGAFDAMKEGMLVEPEGLRKDIAWFFSLPIPKAVWKEMKSFQDADFVGFVEAFREE